MIQATLNFFECCPRVVFKVVEKNRFEIFDLLSNFERGKRCNVHFLYVQLSYKPRLNKTKTSYRSSFLRLSIKDYIYIYICIYSLLFKYLLLYMYIIFHSQFFLIKSILREQISNILDEVCLKFFPIWAPTINWEELCIRLYFSFFSRKIRYHVFGMGRVIYLFKTISDMIRWYVTIGGNFECSAYIKFDNYNA